MTPEERAERLRRERDFYRLLERRQARDAELQAARDRRGRRPLDDAG